VWRLGDQHFEAFIEHFIAACNDASHRGFYVHIWQDADVLKSASIWVPLQRRIAASTYVGPRLDREALERHVRERATAWRATLTGSVEDGRQWFREILVGPIRFTPQRGAKLTYRFDGELAFEKLFSGVAGLAPFVASPAGFEPAFWP
jgi:hypothetical protein